MILLFVVFIWSVLSYPHPQRREWKIEPLNNELRMLSKSLNYSVQDEFDLRFRLVNSPQWILSSVFRYATMQDVNRSQLDFTFDLFYIVEFLPNATVPMYVGDQSTVVSVYPPNKQMKWSPYWNLTEIEVGGVLKRSYARSTEDQVLTLRVHVDQLIANGTETKFLPNSIKYDIELDHFPWTQDGTRVAVVSSISSYTTPSFTDCSNQCVFDGNVLTFQDEYGHPLGVFSWDPKIKVDSGLVPVVAYVVNMTSQSAYPNANMLFTFMTTDKATKMHWDPLQGLDYDNPDPGTPTGIKFLISLAVVFSLTVAIAIAWILYRRYSLRDYNVIQ